MAINPHHTIEEIQGVRCSVVEKKIDRERLEFVREVLELNNFKVQISQDENQLYTIGVTDLTFNPVHAIYNRSLKLPGGRTITPSFWYQQKFEDGFYWEYKRS